MSFDLMSPEFWAAGLQIIIVNLLLSGDNAVVIALACRNLPDRQRKVAIFWGVFGAVAARVGLTMVATSLLALPWLKVVGGALLVWIGVQLIAQDQDAEHSVKASDQLIAAISTVVMRGNVPLLVFGLVLSIPIVVLGSSLVMTLIKKFPWLVVAGGGLLGYIAGEMAIRDSAAAGLLAAQPWLERGAAYGGLVIVVALGLLVSRLRRGEAPAP